MPNLEAIWFPYWYELDQSIAVGQVADFSFYKVAPHRVASDGRPVFYHDSGKETDQQLFETRQVRIVAIRHPQLGSIEAIDANDLDYTFLMTDGRIFAVEAEETPGKIYEPPTEVMDWRVYVQLELL